LKTKHYAWVNYRGFDPRFEDAVSLGADFNNLDVEKSLTGLDESGSVESSLLITMKGTKSVFSRRINGLTKGLNAGKWGKKKGFALSII
jgi:hypothetical protein